MNFGVVDETDLIENKPDIPKYLEILKNVSSALGLDLSMNSTGVCMWDGEELKFACIDVNVNKIAEEEMRKELKDALIQVVGNKEFSMVIVEDVYDGFDFRNTRKLVSLNTVPDELLREGYIKGCKTFKKYNNKVWKKILRHYKKVDKCPTDKIEINEMISSLGFDITSVYKFNTSDKKDRYQDCLDSLGLVLAGITENILKIVDTRKYSLKDMKVWYCEDIETFESCYWDGESEYRYLSLSRKFKSELVNLIKDTEAEVTIAGEIEVDDLGKYALDLGIPLEMERVCIVCTPKSKPKPRKRKPNVRIILG